MASGNAKVRVCVSRALFMFLLITGVCDSIAADALRPAVQAQLAATTFEVVMKKPTADSMQYERPLPLERLSYSERTDPHRATGTAFAIGPNTFVSAAHVLDLGRISQYGQPALRDSAGVIYAIDTVVKYSNERDFIVFNLKTPPPFTAPVVLKEAAVNTPVFAVGNALGEGIVVRDGLLTSTTPEEVNGRWNWLRFSAAASPGNSGGPLVDADGRVLGVVLSRSANENLNFALPIQVVLDAPAMRAQLGGFFGYQLPVLDTIEGERINIDVALPLSLARLYEAVSQHASTLSDRMLAQLLAKNAEHIFPRGPGAVRLLNSVDASQSLTLIMRKPDGTWDSFAPSRTTRATLPRNGSVEVGGLAGHLVLKMRRPDDVAPAVFYGDSKAYLDSLLTALPMYRALSAERIRITSLGAAKKERMFQDSFGRRWQVRTWNLELPDQVLVSFALALPDGYVALLRTSLSSGEADAVRDLQAMVNYAQVSLGGTLSQWRGYLEQKALLPKAFSTIDIGFDYGKTLHYRSARAALEYTEAVQSISDKSVLNLNFAFFEDHSRIVWDVVGVGVRARADGGPSVWLTRHQRPPEALPAELQSTWTKRLQRAYPFDGTAIEDAGNMQVVAIKGSGTAPDSDVLYQLTYRDEGKRPAAQVSAVLRQWMAAASVREE